MAGGAAAQEIGWFGSQPCPARSPGSANGAGIDGRDPRLRRRPSEAALRHAHPRAWAFIANVCPRPARAYPPGWLVSPRSRVRGRRWWTRLHGRMLRCVDGSAPWRQGRAPFPPLNLCQGRPPLKFAARACEPHGRRPGAAKPEVRERGGGAGRLSCLKPDAIGRPNRVAGLDLSQIGASRPDWEEVAPPAQFLRTETAEMGQSGRRARDDRGARLPQMLTSARTRRHRLRPRFCEATESRAECSRQRGGSTSLQRSRRHGNPIQWPPTRLSQ